MIGDRNPKGATTIRLWVCEYCGYKNHPLLSNCKNCQKNQLK